VIRLLAALFFAPLVCWLPRLVFLVDVPGHHDVRELVSSAIRFSVLTYVVALPLGAIALLVFWRFRLLSWWSGALAGAVVVAVVFGPFLVQILFDDKMNDWYKRTVALSILEELVFGAFVGATIWLLGVWRNSAMIRKPQITSSVSSVP